MIHREKALQFYLQWFSENATFLEPLTDNGSIYVHLDWHMVHYVKAIMDEVLGNSNYRNSIVWKRTSAHNDPLRYGNSFR